MKARMFAVAIAFGTLAVSAPAHASVAVAGPIVELPGVILPGGPRCPDQAPAGWEFVRAVQPPFGLAFDLYRKPDDTGAYDYLQVYCRR